MFKKLGSKSVYKNKWMDVHEDDIEFSNGDKGIYGFVQRPDGADVLIVNSKSEVLLIKQYRYPIQAYQWNIPGGAINRGELPEDAARREVEEETGLKITKLEAMGGFYPLSSCSTEKGNLFLAYVDEKVPSENTAKQVDESVQEKRFIPMAEILHMIDNNEITDSYSANALQMLARRMKI